MVAQRTLVVWCPDWPVVAAIRAGHAADGEPVAVLRANRVVAASASARAMGVVRAMRRREAQSRCPQIELVADDPGRDARLFEPIVAALDPFTPRIEIVRPGLCQFPTRGPSRYFGGDVQLADRMRAELLTVLGVKDGDDATELVRLGIADGPFAAAFAARSSTPIVSPGESQDFLAPYSLRALIAVEGGRAVTKAARSTKRAAGSKKSMAAGAVDADAMALIDLVDLLHRLGITTLGALAALEPADVLARFGTVGMRAWRLAAGLDERVPNTRQPPPDLIVETELDPPVERIDTAAFYAKALAEEFTDRLARLGMACTRISIEAETERGEVLQRLWRHERAGAAGGLTAAGLGDRMRWQLDGWLQRMAREEHLAADGYVPRSEMLTGGLIRLRLVPDEVIPDEGRQLGLWGGASAADERASRAFARVQALLGPESVCSVVSVGGRRPQDVLRFIPWGDQRDTPATVGQPWPGQLPSPLPTVVFPLPIAVDVLDANGEAVRVTGRGDISAPPFELRGGGDQAVSRVQRIIAWAGPWPLEERWWDVQVARRQARLQVTTSSIASVSFTASRTVMRANQSAVDAAYLLVLEGGQWWLEAAYA